MTMEQTLSPSALTQPTTRAATRRHWRGQLLRGVLLALTLLFFLVPIAFLVSTSFKTKDDVLTGNFWPKTFFWQNWPDAFDSVALATFMQNSVVAASLSAVLTLVIAVPATYAMVRFGVGGKALYTIVLSSYIAPPVVALLPLFYLLRRMELIDSLLGLALVYGLMNIPVAVWLLDSFVRQIPRDIEEAAWVDGTSQLGTLVRMVLPLIMPGIVATGIICLILSYNEFLFALNLTYSLQSQTLPVGMALFQGDRLVNFGQMAAASLSGMIPVYLVALFFQRWLIRGLTHGAVK